MPSICGLQLEFSTREEVNRALDEWCGSRGLVSSYKYKGSSAPPKCPSTAPYRTPYSIITRSNLSQLLSNKLWYAMIIPTTLSCTASNSLDSRWRRTTTCRSIPQKWRSLLLLCSVWLPSLLWARQSLPAFGPGVTMASAHSTTTMLAAWTRASPFRWAIPGA